MPLFYIILHSTSKLFTVPQSPSSVLASSDSDDAAEAMGSCNRFRTLGSQVNPTSKGNLNSKSSGDTLTDVSANVRDPSVTSKSKLQPANSLDASGSHAAAIARERFEMDAMLARNSMEISDLDDIELSVETGEDTAENSPDRPVKSSSPHTHTKHHHTNNRYTTSSSTALKIEMKTPRTISSLATNSSQANSTSEGVSVDEEIDSLALSSSPTKHRLVRKKRIRRRTRDPTNNNNNKIKSTSSAEFCNPYAVDNDNAETLSPPLCMAPPPPSSPPTSPPSSQQLSSPRPASPQSSSPPPQLPEKRYNSGLSRGKGSSSSSVGSRPSSFTTTSSTSASSIKLQSLMKDLNIGSEDQPTMDTVSESDTATSELSDQRFVRSFFIYICYYNF